MRIVPKDELFVMIERPDLMERGPHRRHPDVEREHPADLRGRRRSGRTDKTVAEIVELGQLLRVAVTPVVDGADVLADEQLAARDWWEREGDIAVPRPAVQVHGHAGGAARARRRPSAPQSGTAPPGRRPRSPAPDRRLRRVGRRRSQGLRILEVTTNWAGPVAGRFLADLGSDNVKVEWATRPATRALFWPGPAPGPAAPGPPPGHCTSTR